MIRRRSSEHYDKISWAVRTLIDGSWSAVRLPAWGRRQNGLLSILENSSPSDIRLSFNPLVDLEFIHQSSFDNNRDLSALDVIIGYAVDLLPRGVSPHPLIDKRIFSYCRVQHMGRYQVPDRGTWVRMMLDEPDRKARAIFPFIDSAFVLRQARMVPSDLARVGARSLSRFYLGVGAREGLLPHPSIDPVFLYVHRTGRFPSPMELRDPGRFLLAELSAYVGQAGRQGRASPSLLFDESFMRRDGSVAKAIRNGSYANAFHAWAVHAERITNQRVTRSGIQAFPEASRPKVWWRPDRVLPAKARRIVDPDTFFLAAAKRRMASELLRPAHVQIDGDIPRAVRVGQHLAIVVHGYALCPTARIRHVELRVGRRSTLASFQGFPRPDVGLVAGSIFPLAERMLCGFAIAWSGHIDRPGPVQVAVRFKTGKGIASRTTRWFPAGDIEIERPIVRLRFGTPAKVAIAMATYEPKPALFRAQLDSIRRQTMADWQLVISDESESPQGRETIHDHVANDTRIKLIHGKRLGFVGNFERALSQLDTRSPFFALSDQDDVWYPQKLEQLVDVIESSGSTLAYAGMRLTSEDGVVLDDSFFSWRQRHGDSTEELLVANTVTGAACLGRMSLMQHILPIPRYRSVFHDMWIALVASRNGPIEFIKGPLQDYVQHEDNVLGHHQGKDRQAALYFARQRRRFVRAAASLLPIEEPINRKHLRLLSALSAYWPEALQRAFLHYALEQRMGEPNTRDPMSIAQLARVAGLRTDLAGNEARTFLNLPGWLSAGALLLSRYDRDGVAPA